MSKRGGTGLLTRMAGAAFNQGKRIYRVSRQDSEQREAIGRNVIGKGISPIAYEKASTVKSKRTLNAIDWI